MDFPIHVDRISIGMSFLYFKRFHEKVLNHDAFLSLKITFILANSAETDEMPRAAFHMGLHCLPKYLFSSWLMNYE